MTSSCTSLRRKHSWADELEDDPSLTQGSDILQRIVPLAKRSGFTHDSSDLFSLYVAVEFNGLIIVIYIIIIFPI